MGKRSSFARVARDFYPTPSEAVAPLLPHLASDLSFVEPCAGAGDLVAHLQSTDRRCIWAFDLAPQADHIARYDAFDMRLSACGPPDVIITNPPWSREPLHRMIDHFSAQRPTWLLFDADWMHTAQAAPHLRQMRKIVSVGRVRWIPGSRMTGKDNCCWYLFDRHSRAATEFVGRRAGMPQARAA